MVNSYFDILERDCGGDCVPRPGGLTPPCEHTDHDNEGDMRFPAHVHDSVSLEHWLWHIRRDLVNLHKTDKDIGDRISKVIHMIKHYHSTFDSHIEITDGYDVVDQAAYRLVKVCARDGVDWDVMGAHDQLSDPGLKQPIFDVGLEKIPQIIFTAETGQRNGYIIRNGKILVEPTDATIGYSFGISRNKLKWFVNSTNAEQVRRECFEVGSSATGVLIDAGELMPLTYGDTVKGFRVALGQNKWGDYLALFAGAHDDGNVNLSETGITAPRAAQILLDAGATVAVNIVNSDTSNITSLVHGQLAYSVEAYTSDTLFFMLRNCVAKEWERIARIEYELGMIHWQLILPNFEGIRDDLDALLLKVDQIIDVDIPAINAKDAAQDTAIGDTLTIATGAVTQNNLQDAQLTELEATTTDESYGNVALLSQLSAHVSNTDTRFGAVATEQTTQNNRITATENLNISQSAQISTLQTASSTQAGDISTLKTQMGGVAITIADFQEQIGNNTYKLATVLSGAPWLTHSIVLQSAGTSPMTERVPAAIKSPYPVVGTGANFYPVTHYAQYMIAYSLAISASLPAASTFTNSILLPSGYLAYNPYRYYTLSNPGIGQQLIPPCYDYSVAYMRNNSGRGNLPMYLQGASINEYILDITLAGVLSETGNTNSNYGSFDLQLRTRTDLPIGLMDVTGIIISFKVPLIAQ